MLYIAVDGTGVPVVAREAEGRRGKADNGKARTREIKLACLFTQTALDDYALALVLVLVLVLGILFQYGAIAPMRGLGVKDGLIAAAKADFISLTAFEVGLFGWMAIMTFALFPAPHMLMPNAAAFWLLMQVGMIIGFCTSWPANVWLIRRGIKVPM